MATLYGTVPVVKSNFVKNELLLIAPPPVNVTTNGALVYAVNPLTVTEIGWYVTPVGNVTLSEVVEAVVTTAFPS